MPPWLAAEVREHEGELRALLANPALSAAQGWRKVRNLIATAVTEILACGIPVAGVPREENERLVAAVEDAIADEDSIEAAGAANNWRWRDAIEAALTEAGLRTSPPR